jgi:hypothetical protein
VAAGQSHLRRRPRFAWCPAAKIGAVLGSGGIFGTQQGSLGQFFEPFRFSSPLASGLLEIVGTAEGERMRLTASQPVPGLSAVVRIKRKSGDETLKLAPRKGGSELESSVAPEEPHEFDAELELVAGDRRDVLPFRMVEPAGHEH